MVEFNGWLKLNLSTDGEDELYAVVKQFEHLVDKARGSDQFPFISYRNGACYIYVAGDTNHLSQEWTDTRHLLDEVALRFPGAYGIVYLHDDEDKHGNYNQYVVCVLRRGKVTQVIDTLLSPRIPLIEE